jgi:hypothetical protein
LTAGDPGQHRGAADGADLYFAGRQRSGLKVAALKKYSFNVETVFREQPLRLSDPKNRRARVERRLTDAELDEFAGFRRYFGGSYYERKHKKKQ